MSNYVQYHIKGSTADGELITAKMRKDFERGYVSVVFYTDDTYQTVAIPTAGTLTVTASEEGLEYGTIIGGLIQYPNTDYVRPNFAGSVERVKITALGIIGASHYIAKINRFEG